MHLPRPNAVVLCMASQKRPRTCVLEWLHLSKVNECLLLVAQRRQNWKGNGDTLLRFSLFKLFFWPFSVVQPDSTSHEYYHSYTNIMLKHIHAQYILLLNPLHTAHISAVGRDCDWKAWNQQPIFTKVPSIVHETKTNPRAEKAWWSWVGASWKCNKICCLGTCPLKSSLLTRDDKGLSVTRGILTDWNTAVRFIAWKRCWSSHIQGQTPCTVKVGMETVSGERLNHSSNLLATCKGCLSFFSITNNQSRMH